MKTITIGDKPLMSITKEDLLQIAVIEGCTPCLEYWSYPEVTDFDNSMFSTSVIVEYNCKNLESGNESGNMTFWFDAVDLTRFYYRDRSSSWVERTSSLLKPESLKFLIKQGYDVPLY